MVMSGNRIVQDVITIYSLLIRWMVNSLWLGVRRKKKGGNQSRCGMARLKVQ